MYLKMLLVRVATFQRGSDESHAIVIPMEVEVHIVWGDADYDSRAIV